jgi:hypothetical protein
VRYRPMALLAGAAICSSCVVSFDNQAYTAREERRFEVSASPELSLVSFDGSIEVRAWDRAEIVVEIERRAADREAAESIETIAEQRGNKVFVEARRPEAGRFRLGRMPSARLVASVPRNCDVTARTADGSISIERVTGRIELRTGDGRIRGNDLAGHLTAFTNDGSIRLEAVQGEVDVETGDGSVWVSGRLAALKAHSDDGSVSVRAETGSAMTADWAISTSDGRIVLELPGGFGAELDAVTGDGSVRVDEALALEVLGEASRRSVRGAIGSGGRTLRLRTGDGSVTVRAN